MKYPTTEQHFRKYDNLCKEWGVRITGDTWMELSREEVRKRLRTDPHLHNVRTLQHWDSAALHLVGKPQPFDSNGDRYTEFFMRDGIKIWKGDPNRQGHRPVFDASLSEAVCAMKHAAKVWCGAEPIFLDWSSPHLMGDYPRLPWWDD